MWKNLYLFSNLYNLRFWRVQRELGFLLSQVREILETTVFTI